jgi:hypothetical protein
MVFVSSTEKRLLTTTLRCVRTYELCLRAPTGTTALGMNQLALNILPNVDQQLFEDKAAQIIKGPTIMSFKKTSLIHTAQSAGERLPRRRLD